MIVFVMNFNGLLSRNICAATAPLPHMLEKDQSFSNTSKRYSCIHRGRKIICESYQTKSLLISFHWDTSETLRILPATSIWSL